MRDIKDLLKKEEKYQSALLQKEFESKKNTVGYVVYEGQPRVFKWFVPGLKQNMDLEYSILQKGCAELAIPSPLDKDTDNNVLIMSYIMGENVCDIINDSHKTFQEKERIILLLADWLVQFHSLFRSEDGFRIRGDASLRNFIFSKDRVWGVDFEESRPGKPSEDVATLCASLLSTDPMFTKEKVQLCHACINAYLRAAKWPVEHLNTEIAYALLERIQWRPQDEETLRHFAERVRKNGVRAACHND
ncbi:MAG: hypothetical protein JXA00_03365 [Candidatus Thermoplasmatota archaeon]|nr:hypothetical protein [Candidatus Thermoplasmatota archaeon]